MTINRRKVCLALQGGGSHGAFTWGVLDQLLEDGRLDFDAISGASAGAMNAAVLCYGLQKGGPDGARQALADFWKAIAVSAPFHLWRSPEILDPLSRGGAAQGAGLANWMQYFSPAQINPFDINPLRDVLDRQIDFELLRTQENIRLVIAATRVDTGTLKVFYAKDMTCDVLLASACLPSMHHTITIDGAAYWDGGLTANPPLIALLKCARVSDVIAVLLNPFIRPNIPDSARSIAERLSEISFTSALHAEVGALALAQKMLAEQSSKKGLLDRKLLDLRMHLIDADEVTRHLESSSKLNVNAAFIDALYHSGRERTSMWLEQNFDTIGRSGSFKLSEYLPT